MKMLTKLNTHSRILFWLFVCAIVMLSLYGLSAEAACRIRWVDHDFNTSTPPVQKQVCENAFDVPDYSSPGIQPIQRPQIQPINPPTVPPIGTRQCRFESVYNPSTRRWEQQRICT